MEYIEGIESNTFFVDENANPKKYSLAEYFDYEYFAEEKHEYHNGEIVAMGYASERHNTIVSNLMGLLFICLRKGNCKVMTSSRMVYVEECGKVFYPDIVIVCESEKFTYSKNMDAETNPAVVIEVLSDSTENEDRGSKMTCYKKIKGLKQYILISQKQKYVEIHERVSEKSWLSTEYTESNTQLQIGNCEVLLEEIYEKVVFEEA
jgi:Uma2 family endonuclease